MANYLVLLKYSGNIQFPTNFEKAKAEIQQLLLPHVMHDEFELVRVEPWVPSQSSAHSYKAEGPSVVLEVKIKLTDEQVMSPDKIMQKIKARLQRGHFYNERITIEKDHGGDYTLITLSELTMHHRYIVIFHYQGVLEALGSNVDDVIVREVQLLLQSGEMAMLGYSPATTEANVDCLRQDVTGDETIVEVNVMINEFNVDFHDFNSIYHYVLGELESCGCQLAYKYECSDDSKAATHIGINVYCSYQALEVDDYEDLIQQL